MGRLPGEQGLAPDLVLCSAARRAAHSWELAAAGLGASVPVRFDDRLYLAAPEYTIAVARDLGGGC